MRGFWRRGGGGGWWSVGEGGDWRGWGRGSLTEFGGGEGWVR